DSSFIVLEKHAYDRLRLPTTSADSKVCLFWHHPGAVLGDLGLSNDVGIWSGSPSRKVVDSRPGLGRRGLDRPSRPLELNRLSGHYHYGLVGGGHGETKET